MKNIVVFIKQVPDTETKIQLAHDGSLDFKAAKWILNPYDEFAVEEAIRLSEKNGATTTVVSMGAETTLEGIRVALAMGIHKAVFIDTQGLNFDSYQTAVALSQVAKTLEADLILCGKQAIDLDQSQVASMVAELLNWPMVLGAEKIEGLDDKLRVTRLFLGSKETFEPTLPVLISAEKGLNTPRYASLPGIMKAKTKPVDKKLASELLQNTNALTKLVAYALPKERAAGIKNTSAPEVAVKELVKWLRDEAKVI